MAAALLPTAMEGRVANKEGEWHVSVRDSSDLSHQSKKRDPLITDLF